MKYQPGDDIIILHTQEEGKVVEVINNKMLLVEVRGVRFPAYTDQVDFPYFKRFSGGKQAGAGKTARRYIDNIPKEKKAPPPAVKAEGVLLSFVPKFTTDEFGDEVIELFKLYLINQNLTGYNFIYEQGFSGETEFDLKGSILMRNDFYLHDVAFADFSDNPFFSFSFSLVTPDKAKADHFDTLLKPRPKQLFQRIEEMKQKNEPSITFKLFDAYPDKPFEAEKIELTPNVARKYKLYQAEKIREHLEPARSVVDLHIEKLSDDWKHLSNFEILTIQLREFEKWFDLAISHRLSSFIVVHGVGSGKLRDEIHDLLKTKHEVKTFINQYHPNFGYGATEIYFQYEV